MNRLPRNKIAHALFHSLWADGADGEELVLGFLGTVRDVVYEEQGDEGVYAMAQCFITDNIDDPKEHGIDVEDDVRLALTKREYALLISILEKTHPGHSLGDIVEHALLLSKMKAAVKKG